MQYNMDLTKAQRLINKIQAFLDDGHAQDLSRLEKDLIKSYVQQLYEAVISDETALPQEKHKSSDVHVQKTQKVETFSQTEAPPVQLKETPKAEPTKPFYSDYIPPAPKPEQPVYTEYKPPVVKEKPVEVEIETQSYQAYKPEPVKETIHTPAVQPTAKEEQEALGKLFDPQISDETSSRFGFVPIASIESAMGLNERIFTLNELFGGDKALFDAWCSKLNSLHSFAEARNVLISGPAKDFKWSDPERIKMAEQFIRIVSRRYPKPTS
jgi:hypothetical protein